MCDSRKLWGIVGSLYCHGNRHEEVVCFVAMVEVQCILRLPRIMTGKKIVLVYILYIISSSEMSCIYVF